MRHYGGAVLEGLERVFGRGTVAGLSEGTLLERFVAGRDEAAFAALVARHGPMVLGVCRRVLRDGHEVDDAFQATFLVLVRRAGTIRDGELVGHWLHGVAHRVAVRARAQAARRHVRERTGTDQDRAEDDATGDGPSSDLRPVLDEELARLPDSLRAPVVLCYLGGLTHEQAALELRCPVGTVRSRMARARDRLRTRLARRGMTASGAALAAAIAADPVPAALLDTTVRVSLIFSANAAAPAALASARAAALAQGVLNAMTISKLQVLGATALAGALALSTLPTFARQLGGSGGGSAPVQRQDGKGQLAQSVEKLEADLEASRRRNAQLQDELQAVKAELEALKSTPKPTAARAAGDMMKAARPGMQGGGLVAPGGMGMGGGMGGGMPGMAGGMGGMGGGMGGMGGGMGGMGGGMGGMGGRMGAVVGDPKRPQYIMSNQLFVVTSPEGDKATAYSTETGKAKTVRLFEAKGPRRRATPIVSGSVAAYYLKGPNITRLAAFSVTDGSWHTQDLREPADEATPIVGQSLVAYGIGRRLYAFSAIANRWDVLELAEGIKPQPVVGIDWVTFEHDGHLYIFSGKTGKWTDIDTRGNPDTPEDK